MYSISDNELQNKSKLGKSIKCEICGKRHKLIYADEIKDGKKIPSDFLAFYKCGKTSYLAGIGGRKI